MINTLNESSLHRTLKNLYAIQDDSKTEVKVDRWICDIVKKNGDIIEIQTHNVSNLKEKIRYFLNANKKITIVIPIVIKKTIETYAQDDILLSKRKSPKSECIYSIFRELTGIYEFLLNENFFLNVVETEITECRLKAAIPVQTKNKSRRFLKDYLITDKKLNKILKTHNLNTKNDFLNLMPTFKINDNANINQRDDDKISATQSKFNENNSTRSKRQHAMSKNCDKKQIESAEDFTTKQIANFIKEKCGAKNAKHAYPMLWVFKRIKLIEENYKVGKTMHYKIVNKEVQIHTSL